MSIGAHIARALFIFFGLVVGLIAVALLFTDVHPSATNNSDYSCDSVVQPTSVDPDKLCDAALQTRAQSAQAAATVALGAFVAAAAVAIGSRHRITVQADARSAYGAASAPGY